MGLGTFFHFSEKWRNVHRTANIILRSMQLKNILRIFPAQLMHGKCSWRNCSFTIFHRLLTGGSGFLTGYTPEYPQAILCEIHSEHIINIYTVMFVFVTYPPHPARFMYFWAL